MAFVAVGEIGRVNQTESRRREELALFAFGRGFLDEDGRIPLSEKDAVAFEFEPAFDEVDLGGFAGAIQTLDSDEFSRIIAFLGDHGDDCGANATQCNANTRR